MPIVVETLIGWCGLGPILEVRGKWTLELVRQSYGFFLAGTLQRFNSDFLVKITITIIRFYSKRLGEDMVCDLLGPRLIRHAASRKQ